MDEKKRARKVLRSHERKLIHNMAKARDPNWHISRETLMQSLVPIRKMRKSTEVCDTHPDALAPNEKALMYEVVNLIALLQETPNTHEERYRRVDRYAQCLDEFEELYNQRRGTEKDDLENVDTDSD